MEGSKYFNEAKETVEFFHQHRQQLLRIQEDVREPVRKAVTVLSDKNGGQRSSPLQDVERALQTAEEKSQRLFDLVGIGNIFEPRSTTLGVDQVVEGASSARSCRQPPDERQNPYLAVVGQTKAGKSSLINAIIGHSFLEQAPYACTTRITTVTYGKCSRYRLRYPDGKISDWRELQRNEKMESNVAGDDKFDKEMVRTIVEAEAPSEFLKCGIDVVDSPGRAETKLLDNLTQSIFDSLLPLLVYVIDGRNGLRDADYNDLLHIKSHPHSNIFFVVTRLDTEKVSRRAGHAVNEITSAKNQMRNIYEKLVQFRLLSSRVSMEDCAFFHGVSLLPTKLNDGSFFQNAFQRLRRELFQYISNQLTYRVIDASHAIKSTIQPIIQGCIQRTTTKHRNLHLSKHELDLKIIVEQKIFEFLFQMIKEDEDSIKSLIKDVVHGSCLSARSTASSFIYTAEIQEQMARCSTLAEARLIREICREQLSDHFIFSLTTELKELLHNLFVERLVKIKSTFNDQEVMRFSAIADHFNAIGGDDAEKSLRTCFQKLVSKRVMKDLTGVYENWLQFTFILMRFGVLDRLKEFFRQLKMRIVKIIMEVFSRTANTGGQPKWEELLNTLREPKWKGEQADVIIGQINSTFVIDEVYSWSENFIKRVHDEESQKLLEIKALHEAYSRSDEKKHVDEITKELSQTFVQLQHIISCYQIRALVIIETLEKPAGTLGQGFSQLCSINTNEMVVMKQLSSSHAVPECSLALSVLHDMHHDYIQPLMGIHLHESHHDNSTLLRLFTSRRPQSCRRFLQSHSPPDIERRIQIALQVAQALLFLHDRGIFHRNIKLDNVLLDDNGTAILCDFDYRMPVSAVENGESEMKDIVQYGALLHDIFGDYVSNKEECDCPVDLNELVKNCIDPSKASEMSMVMIYEALEKCARLSEDDA